MQIHRALGELWPQRPALPLCLLLAYIPALRTAAVPSPEVPVEHVIADSRVEIAVQDLYASKEGGQ